MTCGSCINTRRREPGGHGRNEELFDSTYKMLSKSQGSVDPHHHVGDISLSLTLSPTYTQSTAVLNSFVYCRLETHSECPIYNLDLENLTRNPRGRPPGWVYRETDRVGAGTTPRPDDWLRGNATSWAALSRSIAPFFSSQT